MVADEGRRWSQVHQPVDTLLRFWAIADDVTKIPNRVILALGVLEDGFKSDEVSVDVRKH
jgi:hypothetical protein